MRTIAIGDVHGCLTALDSLLDAIAPTPQDTLIFLGDYVDRGPDSRGVIDRLIRLSAQCQTVFLRGNHDWVMQRWCEGSIETELWDSIGGSVTRQSYDFPEPDEIPPEHFRFLQECRDYYETELHLFFHANYQPNLAPEKMSLERLHWTHLGWPLPRPHVSGKTVIVGHTPQRSGEIADFGYLICIDTYCFGGGNLTAYDVDQRTALQVNSHGTLVRRWGVPTKRKWFNKLVGWLTTPRANHLTPHRSKRSRSSAKAPTSIK